MMDKNRNHLEKAVSKSKFIQEIFQTGGKSFSSNKSTNIQMCLHHILFGTQFSGLFSFLTKN